jgi:hypothetical protein
MFQHVSKLVTGTQTTIKEKTIMLFRTQARVNLAVLAMIFSIFSSSSALSGVDSSGGGNAVVCRNSEGQIISAEVLDLFEARVLFGRTLVPTQSTAVDHARAMVEKLQAQNINAFLSFRDVYFEPVITKAKVLPPGLELTPINDSFPPAIPKGCKVEQLAAYQSDGGLYINGDIWPALDELNKAALYVHEAMYQFLRYHGKAKDSMRARKIVGLAFSDFRFSPIELVDSAGRIPPNSLRCIDKHNQIFLYIFTEGNLARLSFVVLLGQPVIDLTTMEADPQILNTKHPGDYRFLGEAKSNFENGARIRIIKTGSILRVEVESAFGIQGMDAGVNLNCLQL